MSTRASLLANPGAGRKARELGESVYYLPLLWVTLIAPDDLARAEGLPYVSVDRRQAVKRCADALGFVGELFPELAPVEEAGEQLLDVLKRVRADSVGVLYADFIERMFGSFLPALAVAVAALERKDAKAVFNVPAGRVSNPFTGKTMRVQAVKCRSTRDLLRSVTGIPLNTGDEEEVRDQLIGDISWADPDVQKQLKAGRRRLAAGLRKSKGRGNKPRRGPL